MVLLLADVQVPVKLLNLAISFQVDNVLNLVSSLVCDQDDQPSEPVSK